MDDCPCGSGSTYDDCCGPYVRGDEPAPTAEALMRSRYSAYTMGEVDYVLATHDPATSEDVDPEEIRRWSTSSEWLGLKILDATAGGPDDDEGEVAFVAKYRLDGTLHNHRERSHFIRSSDGRWLFSSVLDQGAGVSGKPQPEIVPVGARAEVGRNDPCTCGSGKKYKKCCG